MTSLEEEAEKKEKETEKRLKKDSEEAMGEAVDCLWSSNGKFNWISQKQMFCPQYITAEDLKEMQTLLTKLESKENPLDECRHKLLLEPKQRLYKTTLSRIDQILERIKQLKDVIKKLIQRINIEIVENESNT